MGAEGTAMIDEGRHTAVLAARLLDLQPHCSVALSILSPRARVRLG